MTYGCNSNSFGSTEIKRDVLGEKITFMLGMLEEGGEIQLSLFLNLCQGVFQLIFCGVEPPDSFYNMEEYLQVWANNNMLEGKVSHDEACAGLFALTQIYDRKRRKAEEKETLRFLKHKMSGGKGEQILRSILENPGIRHDELASKVGISPLQLSQFVARTEHYRLFSTMKPAWEKLYYIEENGREIVEIPDEDDERMLAADKNTGEGSVMGGKVLDYEAKRIRNEGIKEGLDEPRDAQRCLLHDL